MIKCLQKYFRPINKKQTLAEIEAHLKLNYQAGQSIDKLIAALDGETHWFECGCKEVEPKKKQVNNHGSFSGAPSSQCHI